MSKSADAFRTISEVADWLGIPAHVLRFWESKFTQVKPVKRAGGRRYYRPADMQLLGGIRKLLHDEGMTIKGVQKVMRDQGVRHVAAMSPPLDADLEEAIAGIALDVTEAEEPRGTVLSFDRGSADAPQAAEPQLEDDAPSAPPVDAEENAASAESDAEIPAPQKPASADPTDSTSAPDDASDASAPAEEDHTGEPRAAQPTPKPATEAARTSPAPPEDAAPAAPAPAEPATKRPARITVPDDPVDTVPAPASQLSALAGMDAAALDTHRPALRDLSGRMAELRARMGSAKTS
ncbi:MerR family transcriptional regulator [Pelagivirga sediminicola]|uniref:MerR family transcriptional regulator n=1 Tax=Pelagivirga sediminicola TaxID=2170575 RepID=A0A2T7GAQ7_9RHOB|nr:MerR family transcriptional regulator [Pelagivirga sediminicola]PVA11510.1 MerR family transcriptional regulator [Pelagivirga sediminicola]